MVRGTALGAREVRQLSLADVMQPAIKLADEGFAATPRYSASSCNYALPELARGRRLFLSRWRPRAVVGSLVQNKPLAETFRLIAANGPDCFYKLIPAKGCDIAKGIVEGQKFNRPQAPNGKGGSMTYADLENYQADRRKPTEGTYRGYRIKASRAADVGRPDDDPDAEDARALPDRRREPGLRLRFGQDRRT